MQHPENGQATRSTDNTGIEVAVLDAQGVIVAVNGPWTDFCEANDGNPALTGVGADYLKVCDQADGEPSARAVADAIRAALSGDGPIADRIQIACHAPHQKRWFDVLVTSRSDDTGTATGATVMLVQVPERRTDPVESEQGLAREILEACPDALLMADEHGVIQSINRPAEQLFGADRAELLGRTLDTLLSDPLTDPTTSGTELRAIRTDGSEIPVEIGLSLQNVDGEERIIAAIRNITERVRADQRSRMIQRCIDGTSDAILVFDEHSLRFLYVNKGAVAIFGYNPTELIDRMSIKDLTVDLSLEQLTAPLGTLRDSPRQHTRLTTDGRSKTGSLFPIEIQLNWPLADGPNAPRPVAAIVRDLSDRPHGPDPDKGLSQSRIP